VGRCPRCRCTCCGDASCPCVGSGQQPADGPFCQQAQIRDTGLLNFSPMRASFGVASCWGKHERRSRSANDAVACLNLGTRHLAPVSARQHVVKGGTLGQKMRPLLWSQLSRPTRASEWPWAPPARASGRGRSPAAIPGMHVVFCCYQIIFSSPPEGRMFRPLAFFPRTLSTHRHMGEAVSKQVTCVLVLVNLIADIPVNSPLVNSQQT
jgi:hypothetical protein